MLYDDKRLSQEARSRMDGEAPVFHSPVSFWEIALKRSGSGFDFEIETNWDEILPHALEDAVVPRIDLLASDCRKTEDLPMFHRDPFDRMLIAQALNRGLGILSRDDILDDYGVSRVW